MPRAKLKNTNCPHSHYIQGLKMNPLPAHLSALKTGGLLTTQTQYRTLRQRNGAFCFGKLYNPFSYLTFNSPTGIRREVENNQSPFPLSQAQEHIQKGSGSIFSSSTPSPFTALISSFCDSLFFSSPTPHCRYYRPLRLGPSVSKALPKCFPTAV